MIDEHPTTDTERRTHAVIGIPCLLTGGTEMQTLLLVKVLTGVHVGGQSSDRNNPTARTPLQQPEETRSNVPPSTSPYCVTVICYFEFEDVIVQEFRKAGAEVVLLDLDRNISAWALIGRLRAVFLDLKPDIIHIQYMAPGLLPIIAARLAGVQKLIATVHQPATPYGILPRLFLRIGATLCRKFICVSYAAEKSWFGSCSDTSHGGTRQGDNLTITDTSRHLTIHNAVDIGTIDRILGTTDRKQLRHNLNLEGSLIIGAVARLSHEKGVDRLLTAFATVTKSCPDARLLIVGEGREGLALAEQARSLGIDHAVTWLGSQPWEKAIQYVAVMDIVAIPSRYEGFGLTAIEAMACCKPVVATHVGGLPELVEDGKTGLLVPPHTTQDTAMQILHLLATRKTRLLMGIAGRNRAEELFGMKRFADRWHSIYRQCVLFV